MKYLIMIVVGLLSLLSCNNNKILYGVWNYKNVIQYTFETKNTLNVMGEGDFKYRYKSKNQTLKVKEKYIGLLIKNEYKGEFKVVFVSPDTLNLIAVDSSYRKLELFPSDTFILSKGEIPIQEIKENY